MATPITPKIKTVRRAIADGFDPKSLRCEYIPRNWPPKPPFLSYDGFVECHLNALPEDVEEFICYVDGQLTYRYANGELERVVSSLHRAG